MTQPLTDPRRETRKEVERLHDLGFSARKIAFNVGISTQRVYQILKDLELSPSDQEVTS